jgi:uncharacterized protein (DUF1330 family)
MPKGYVIFDIEVTDPVAYREYERIAGPLASEFGGRLLASRHKPEPLDGDWLPANVYIVEFDSVEDARSFYMSERYQNAIPLRQRASKSRGILLIGA